ncbi:Putative NADH-flavin reductase [Cedecea davisae]|nr:Putative NADH-flavin reductase [Cedecea davisae]
MRIFVTGATGFLGTVIVQQLIASGYQVLGLTRSERGAELLKSLGLKHTLAIWMTCRVFSVELRRPTA